MMSVHVRLKIPFPVPCLVLIERLQKNTLPETTVTAILPLKMGGGQKKIHQNLATIDVQGDLLVSGRLMLKFIGPLFSILLV